MQSTGRRGLLSHHEGRWTLRGQLIGLLILFTVGPLLLTNAWGYMQSRRYAERRGFIDARHVSVLEATAVLRLVHEEYQLISALVAGNQHLFGLIRALATTDADAREAVRKAIKTQLSAKVYEGNAIDELYVLDTRGGLITTTRSEHPPQAESRQRCFRRGRQVAAIDGMDWGGSSPDLLISAPITDTSGTFLGVMCARMRVELGVGAGAENPWPASSTSVYLVDTHGRLIAFEAAHPIARPGKQLPSPTSRHSYSNKSWEGKYDTANGRVLASYAPIDELGWGILVETPRRAALGMLDTLLWQAGFFALLVTVLVVVTVIGVARRISQPVMALSAAARHAAGGALGVQVAPGGTVEVRDLAHSFNQMIAAVKDSHDLLEQRIEERTHALRSSQELSERLLDSIDQPVVVVRPELTVITANEAALRRYGRDLVDRAYDDIFEPHGRPFDCPVRATLKTGAPASAEHREHIDHVEDIVSLQTFPVMSRDGNVDAVIELRRVITDERKLQAQMVHQEKMSAFGMMAAGVAHEIGNPLAGIQSQLTLARDTPSPERIGKTLDVVTREVERIARLLREMVQFARRRDEPAVLVTLDQLSNDVVRLIQHDPRAHDVTIEVVPGDGATVVRAEEDALVQVLLNLGLNALDAMPNGGRLVFEPGTVDGRGVVCVRDSGHGLSERARSHMFEPFFTTKAAGRGTGLGLFVSKGIVERLGGELKLETTGPEGTVFCVYLPLAKGWR